VEHRTLLSISVYLWHRGKYYLCPEILDHFPPHDTYVEPFVGGLSVLIK
jgi:DNA adenine methylase